MYVPIFNASVAVLTEALRAKLLREQYPNHSVVLAQDSFSLSITRFAILSLPGVESEPLSKPDLILNNTFVPLPRGVPTDDGAVPAKLVATIEYGGFKITWKV